MSTRGQVGIVTESESSPRARRIFLFRMTLEGVDALQQAWEALAEGRGHRAGHPVPVYSAEDPDTAEREFRAHLPPDPVGTKVRTTPLTFDGLLLDGTSAVVQQAAGVSHEGLVDEGDRSHTQALCDYARSVGADAVRVPSVRHEGGFNVIIFYESRTTLTPGEPTKRAL